MSCIHENYGNSLEVVDEYTFKYVMSFEELWNNRKTVVLIL